jgi:hypothetical protein
MRLHCQQPRVHGPASRNNSRGNLLKAWAALHRELVAKCSLCCSCHNHLLFYIYPDMTPDTAGVLVVPTRRPAVSVAAYLPSQAGAAVPEKVSTAFKRLQNGSDIRGVALSCERLSGHVDSTECTITEAHTVFEHRRCRTSLPEPAPRCLLHHTRQPSSSTSA